MASDQKPPGPQGRTPRQLRADSQLAAADEDRAESEYAKTQPTTAFRTPEREWLDLANPDPLCIWPQDIAWGLTRIKVAIAPNGTPYTLGQRVLNACDLLERDYSLSFYPGYAMLIHADQAYIRGLAPPRAIAALGGSRAVRLDGKIAGALRRAVFARFELSAPQEQTLRRAAVEAISFVESLENADFAGARVSGRRGIDQIRAFDEDKVFEKMKPFCESIRRGIALQHREEITLSPGRRRYMRSMFREVPLNDADVARRDAISHS